MGREALTAALCWFTIGGALAVKSLSDNVSAESASRLYRNLQSAGVYARGAPYGAYSFQIPLVTAPKAAASRVIPVKENYSFQNMNAYLKDSYGNRFVESKQSPQSVPFKPFPQQYVQLQELPAHFAQPLAAPSFAGYKHGTPQIIVGSHYRLPQQAASPIKQHFGFPQEIYAGNIKSLAPQSISHSQFHGPVIQLPVHGQSYTRLPVTEQSYGQPHGQSYSQLPGESFHFGSKVTHDHQQPTAQSHPTAQQQSLSNEAIYANTKSEEQYHHDNGPKFQRQLEVPREVSYHFGSKVTHGHQQPAATTHSTAQQQSSSNEAIYANTKSEEQYHHDNGPKFQQQQEVLREVSSKKEHPESAHQLIVNHSDKAEQKIPVRDTTITSFMNGKETRVNIKTKPTVPLLDISLLEPLTFDNPFVPQVQHFLPKISEATYHKLSEFNGKKNQKPTHKTKSYDSGNEKVKPKKFATKKKQRYPHVEVQNTYYEEIPSASTVRPVITVKGTPNVSPEFSYEINSPNYKETYTEQAINYNKETQSEPVHITYGTQNQEEPVHYTYVHSSKEPVHIKEVHYEGKGEGPKHLLHKFKSVEHNKKDENHESEDSGESSEEDSPRHLTEHRDDNNQHQQKYDHYHDNHNNKHQENNINQHHENHDNQNQHHENQNHHHEKHNQYHESPNTTPHQKPEHREEEYHHKPGSGSNQNQHDDHHSFKPIQYYTKTSSGIFQPLAEYEEEIKIAAPIKVDPNQHVQTQSEPRHQTQPSHAPRQHSYPSSAPHHISEPQQKHNGQSQSEPRPQSSPAPQQHSYPSSAPDHNPAPHHNFEPHQKHHAPTAHVHEKTKSIIIQEETPEHSDEEDTKEMFGREEDSEKDFETAYKNAAFGFPAYGRSIDVLEKDIYNPDSYGVPRDHGDFDIKHSPFQQYHDQSDNFPKNSRLSYKDTKDKTKEDYFLDYSVSKPESLTDRYTKKVDYYKLYKHQKPEKYIAHDDDSQKKQKTSEKYTTIPYNFYPTQDLNMKQFFAQYKMTPFVQEIDYSKGTPRDSSAHSTQPYHRYKSNTFFVEPQFQYGFEPISIPRLLDSELSTMASNDSPESEKPGMRKKIYKENFYIKKTSMSDAGPNS
ncbi:Uncharacterized protein OBRU01_09417 [Operophtera brumata]|uniref:Uncharacterized protein n=1 Tax=Operophtera brumata TaxID=104452 RepID=A0A0L7L2D8_OPEBR|nr:Uncharacterized protein OBRU01_09417 [Operophtera brumata]